MLARSRSRSVRRFIRHGIADRLICCLLNLTSTELNTSQHSQSHLVLGETPKSDVIWSAASIAWSQFHHFPACEQPRCLPHPHAGTAVLASGLKSYRLSCSARSIGVTSAYIPNFTVWFSGRSDLGPLARAAARVWPSPPDCCGDPSFWQPWVLLSCLSPWPTWLSWQQ